MNHLAVGTRLAGSPSVDKDEIWVFTRGTWADFSSWATAAGSVLFFDPGEVILYRPGTLFKNIST